MHAHVSCSRVLHPHVERNELVAPAPSPLLARLQQRGGNTRALLLLRNRHRLNMRMQLPSEVVTAAGGEGEPRAHSLGPCWLSLGNDKKIGGKGLVQVSQHDCVVSAVDVLGHAPGGHREVAETVCELRQREGQAEG